MDFQKSMGPQQEIHERFKRKIRTVKKELIACTAKLTGRIQKLESTVANFTEETKENN